MRGTNPITVATALTSLLLACSGCASEAVRPAEQPSRRMFADPRSAYPGAGTTAFALPFDPAGGDEIDGFGVRKRRRSRAPLPIPIPVPGGWALPPGFGVPALPIPFPTFPSPGKSKVPAPSVGAPAAVAYARSKLGLPYCWGGSGPNCYDCSGLTSASWKAGGKAIPRTSEEQAAKLPEVPLDRALPGDILWRPGHVALYIGDGQIIQAPHTGDVVKISPAVKFDKALRP